MRVGRMLVLAVLAACASAPRGAAGLAGTYGLRAVNGQPLPAPAGDELGVTLHEGRLVLEAGGRYALRMLAAVQSQAPPGTAEIAGTWRVSGDSLALFPDPESNSAEVHFRFAREGPLLRLHDEYGDEFTFRRQ